MQHVERFTGDETITLQQAVEVLNRLIGLDPNFLGQLANFRVPASPPLAADPFVRTAPMGPASTQRQIGLLGVLNAFFGVDAAGNGGITGNFEPSTGRLTSVQITGAAPAAPPQRPNPNSPDPNHDPTGGRKAEPPPPSQHPQHPDPDHPDNGKPRSRKNRGRSNRRPAPAPAPQGGPVTSKTLQDREGVTGRPGSEGASRRSRGRRR